MLPTIKALREAAGGLPGLTDEEIIQATYPQYQRYYPSVDAFAREMGYGGAGRGMAGSRVSAGIDNYQANLYGLAGAVARGAGADGVAEWADRGRERNESAAGYAQRRAQELGAVDDWRDVNGVGSALNYVGGLAAQSLPYLGEAAVGGLVTRGLMSGTRAALSAAKTPEAAAAARRALNLGSMAGAAGASYPSAVADVLSSQRDENGGENLLSAAAGGVPYAALNAVGLEGVVARGLRPIASAEGGLARRAARGAAATAVSEGASETGQEMANQYFGRMAVNPDQTMFNPEANERYLDSFVGGAALGGVFGGVGGLRRADQPARDIDLLNEPAPRSQPLALGYDPDAMNGEIPRGEQPYVVMPDGSTLLRSEYAELVRTGKRPDGAIDFIPPTPGEMSAPRGEGFAYEGGIDFTPGGPVDTGADIRSPGLQVPAGVPGAQPDLFDPLAERVPQEPMPDVQEDAAPAPDTYTRDMLAETPTAMVPTMFNPATEPGGDLTTAAGPGAVASEMRSQLVQQLGKGSGYTSKLALDLSRVITDVPATMSFLADEQTKLDKALQKLDKKVSGESNMLTPEEYEQSRATIEEKMLALEAAKQLAQRYNKALVNAYADEARARETPPNPNPNTAPAEPSATEQEMREQSMAAAVADTDARVAGAQAQRSAQAREDILSRILADKNTGNPQARFEAELRRQGYTEATATTGELEKIARFMTAKAAFPKSGSRKPQSREALTAELQALDERIDVFTNLLACLRA